MGPRLASRGLLSAAGTLRIGLRPSMGPRLASRGLHRPARRARARTRPSMGPRLTSRGLLEFLLHSKLTAHVLQWVHGSRAVVYVQFDRAHFWEVILQWVHGSRAVVYVRP